MLENFPLYCPKCKQETLINILMVGRITIVAAHRFSTIKNADKIIMRGHISGRGSHEELIKNNSLHQELLKIQVKGYETN